MIVLTLIVLGLAFGSFINALVWRLHEQSKIKSKQLKIKKYSILKGRSMCPHCHSSLATGDLIPVLSWLWLGGKCRYCHKPISAQYPLVELITTLLFIFSYVYWPFIFNSKGTTLFIFWLFFLTGMIALAVYDLKWYLLPDKIIKPLILLGLAQTGVILYIANSPTRQLANLLLSIMIGGGIFYLIFQISAGKWIGGGDVKLGALLGLILADGNLIFLAIFMASLLGTIVSLPLLVTGKFKRTSKIPFGPFLIAGAFIARLSGVSLIAWYKHQAGI